MAEDVLQTATYGVGAEIARQLGITSQAWSSRIRNRPLRTIKETILVLIKLNKTDRAQLIAEDFQAFIRVEIEPAAAVRRQPPLFDIVEKLHQIIRLEIGGGGFGHNRFAILEGWRELLVLASGRVRELSAVLDSESRLDYGIAR